MFELLLQELEAAMDALKQMRDGARRKGWPLEEIHGRMVHLEQAIKLVRQAKAAFERSLSPPDDDSIDEEAP